MLNSYDTLVQIALEHYRLGCTKPILKSSEDLFNRELQTRIQERLSLTDYFLMRRVLDACQKGLHTTRRGQLVIAERLFAEARAALKSDSLSLEGRLLHQSFLEAAEAYLDYRCSDFDQAYTKISKALAIDVVLEEEYGYEILHLHRIQLLHNLVRSDARQMKFASAIELACQLLNYLEGKSEVLPFSTSWGYEHIVRQPRELVTAMFVQITSEVALILAGKNHQVKSELFAIVKHHIQLQANGNIRCHSQSHTWFLLKEAFVDNDIATFLKRASHFLAEGRGNTPLLWYAVVVDLIILCDQLDLSDSELFKQQVGKDAVSWEYLPERFFPLLGVPPKMLNYH